MGVGGWGRWGNLNGEMEGLLVMMVVVVVVVVGFSNSLVAFQSKLDFTFQFGRNKEPKGEVYETNLD